MISLGTKGPGVKSLAPLHLFWPEGHTCSQVPMAWTETSVGTASKPNFCTGLTFSQVFLPTLLPLNLLRVNFHFRVGLLGKPAKGKPCFVKTFPRLCNFLFSQKTQRSMSGLLKAMPYNPHGCTGFLFYIGSSRDKDNVQTNTAHSQCRGA